MKPLAYGSLRYHLWKLLHGADLRAGRPVVLTREQLAGAFPRGREQHPSLPESYDAESYTLTGADTLTPNP